MCWYAQPPQRPKYGQRGSTRSGDAVSMESSSASANFFLSRTSRAVTFSPGITKGKKHTLPS